jgi:hypothetical protein
MKKPLLIVAALAVLALGGCAHYAKMARLADDTGFNPDFVRKPDPLLPNLYVVDGKSSKYVTADQSPIRIGPGDVRDGRITISWALDARSPYVFTERGIVITPGPTNDTPVDVKCGFKGKVRKVFECSYKAIAGKTTYKYAAYVVNPENSRDKVEPLDPYLANDI